MKIVLPVRQIEFGVELVFEKKLHHHFSLTELLCQFLEAGLIRVGGDADGQLMAELGGEFFAKLHRARLSIRSSGRAPKRIDKSVSCGRIMPTSSRAQCPSPPGQGSTEPDKCFQPHRLK